MQTSYSQLANFQSFDFRASYYESANRYEPDGDCTQRDRADCDCADRLRTDRQRANCNGPERSPCASSISFRFISLPPRS